MADAAPAPHPPMLAKDYWVVRWVPEAGVTAESIGAVLPAHLEWLLGLEREGVVFLSGPLLEGPGVGPGSGLTVLRAASRDEAEAIAGADPFVVAGLRHAELLHWRLNEGSVTVRLGLGTGSFDWA